jgi:hypothetical protein
LRLVPALAQQPLPAPPMPRQGLEFTGPEAGWPPQVKGSTNIRVLPIEPGALALTPKRIATLRVAAEQEPSVRQALGDRFTFTGADLAETESVAINHRLTSA